MLRAWGTVALAIGTLVVAPGVASAARFAVGSPADGVDARPGDGACRTADGRCTLRAAVQESNATPGADTITLPAGRVVLDRPLRWPLPSQTADLELDPANGDLDILGTVTVRGAGVQRTTIDAGGLDRAFNVEPGSTATVEDLTITHGDATKNDKTGADIALGGAILNNGTLTVDRVALVRNAADGGGGIFSIPLSHITVRNSFVAFNTAVEGGGLRLDHGGTIVNTTITGNRLVVREFGKYIPDEITGYGGGIDHRGGDDVFIVNSTITDNHAVKAGGGVNTGQDYVPIGALTDVWPFRVHLRNTIVAGNTADAGPANCHVSAMVIESQGHNLASDGTCFLTAAGDLPGRDPLLRAVGARGGSSLAEVPMAGSPAIDAGGAEGCPQTDQLGLARPQGGACDIGAVEAGVAPACRASRSVALTLRGVPRGARVVSVRVRGARLVSRRGRRVVVRFGGRGARRAAVRVRVRYRAAGRMRVVEDARAYRLCARTR